MRGRMIFVVGARRSGTNWVQRVLDAHPSVAAIQSETYMFSHGLQPLRDRFHHGSRSSTQTGVMFADRNVLLDAMRDLCDAVFADALRSLDPSAERLVERTPDHVRHLGLISEIYPDAHVVHVVRDGRDVVRSLMNQSWGPKVPRTAATEWRTAIEAARAAAPAVPHLHEVRYEELHAEPAAVIAALYRDLNLDVTDDVMQRALAESRAAYNADPNAPTLTVGKWQDGLAGNVLDAVTEVAGDVLADLGYTDAAPAAARPKAPPATPLRARLRFARQRRRDDAQVRHELDQGQIALNGFISAATSDPRAVAAMLAEDVHVRIVDANSRMEGRGEDGTRRLIDAFRADAALRGRQAFGYIHPSLPALMWVGAFEHGGRSHPRVLIVDLAGDRFSRVAYYGFPPYDSTDG
jgi:hypothetical protein